MRDCAPSLPSHTNRESVSVQQTEPQIEARQSNAKRLEQRQRILRITIQFSSYLEIHREHVLSDSTELHHDSLRFALQLEVLDGGDRHPVFEVHAVRTQLE